MIYLVSALAIAGLSSALSTNNWADIAIKSGFWVLCVINLAAGWPWLVSLLQGGAA